jgi:hypothetical protein
MLNALIDILIEKKIISEEDFEKKLEEAYTECCDDEDCECDEEDSESKAEDKE